MQPRPATLPDLLDQSASNYPNHLALVMKSGLRDDCWSYLRLQQESRATAAALIERGLRPGERVVLWAPSSPRTVAAMFGAFRAGLVVVPLEIQTPIDVAHRIVEIAEASLAIVFGNRGRQLSIPTVDLESLTDQMGTATSVPDSVSPEDLAEIVFTSGTTGQPKGVQLTHGNITANVRSAAVLPHGPDHRLVSLLPLSHMLEQTGGLFFPLASGASVAYSRSRQSSAILRELRARRPTTLVVAPQILELLIGGIERELDRRGRLQHWRAAHRLADRIPPTARRMLFAPVHQALGGSLRWIFSGGAALQPDLQAVWERLGITVMQGYGATECAPLVSCNRPGRQIAGSVGWPLPGVNLRFADDGELLVHGANVTPGYWRDDEATSAIVDHGWYRTGDLARIGEQGELYLQGRKREAIILPSGMNVFPVDVEPALLHEPAIRACAVVGWSEKGDPAVHAVIVPTPESSKAGIAAAIRRVNARLASHQQVTGWTFWPEAELPLTATRKVRKQEIVNWLNHQAPISASPTTSSHIETRSLHHLLARAARRDVSEIHANSDLTADLGLDSLARIELAVSIEESLGQTISDEAIGSAVTVSDLESIINAAGSAQPQPDLISDSAFSSRARAVRTVLQCAMLFPLINRLCCPLSIQGSENLDQLREPALFIANHSSHLDAALVLRSLPPHIQKRMAVAAAKDYFFTNQILGGGATLFLGAFPFARSGAILPSMELCGRLMDRGISVLIFPEGTRSLSGMLQDFRPGIGVLARELGVPVVSVGLIGAARVLPKGGLIPHPGPVQVIIGEPRQWDGHAEPSVIARALHDTLESMLRAECS